MTKPILGFIYRDPTANRDDQLLARMELLVSGRMRDALSIGDAQGMLLANVLIHPLCDWPQLHADCEASDRFLVGRIAESLCRWLLTPLRSGVSSYATCRLALAMMDWSPVGSQQLAQLLTEVAMSLREEDTTSCPGWYAALGQWLSVRQDLLHRSSRGARDMERAEAVVSRWATMAEEERRQCSAVESRMVALVDSLAWPAGRDCVTSSDGRTRFSDFVVTPKIQLLEGDWGPEALAAELAAYMFSMEWAQGFNMYPAPDDVASRLSGQGAAYRFLSEFGRRSAEAFWSERLVTERQVLAASRMSLFRHCNRSLWLFTLRHLCALARGTERATPGTFEFLSELFFATLRTPVPSGRSHARDVRILLGSALHLFDLLMKPGIAPLIYDADSGWLDPRHELTGPFLERIRTWDLGAYRFGQLFLEHQKAQESE